MSNTYKTRPPAVRLADSKDLKAEAIHDHVNGDCDLPTLTASTNIYARRSLRNSARTNCYWAHSYDGKRACSCNVEGCSDAGARHRVNRSTRHNGNTQLRKVTKDWANPEFGTIDDVNTSAKLPY